MRKAETTLRRCRNAAITAVLVGAVGSVFAFVSTPTAFWPAYLTAYLYFWQLSVGLLGLSLMRCIIRSAWGSATWPYLRSSLVTITLMALLFVPIGFSLPSIFPWAVEGVSDATHGNTFQAVYFRPSFFLGRAVAYFVIWLASALIAVRTGTPTGDAALPRRLSSFALIAVVLSSTFAAIDWGMSLEPEWYSTIYGAMVLMTGAVGAWAVLILSVASLLRVPRNPGVRIRQVLNDLGNLLLAFLMIWAYFAFSQYLIIWSGNLPAEVTWYLRRSSDSWQVVLLLIVAFHFVVPFFALLPRERKQNPRWLAWLALILLAANLIQTIWTYAPAFAEQVTDIHWSLVATLLAIGGCWSLGYVLALAWSLNSTKLMRTHSNERHVAKS